MTLYCVLCSQCACLPCRLIERCSHCESLSRAGVQLLAEFQNHADSEFGAAILVKRIMRGSGEDDVLQAAIAATTLIRHGHLSLIVTGYRKGKP